MQEHRKALLEDKECEEFDEKKSEVDLYEEFLVQGIKTNIEWFANFWHRVAPNLNCWRIGFDVKPKIIH